jgi:putative hydrolase of the HAD superfamily
LTRARANGFDRRVELRAILFDYGGTLDGAASHWLDRMVELFRAAGVERPYEDLKTAFYRADDAAYAEPAVGDMSLAELMRFHIAHQLAALGIEDAALHRQLVDGFVDRSTAALADSRAVLMRLAERYRLGVVSNFYGNVARILADARIAPLLSAIADSNRVGCMKPDRRLFEHALRGLGTPAQATLHVGDSYERDVRAAHAIGLRTAWLVRGHRRGAGVDPLANLTVSSLDELARLLERSAPALAADG